MMYAIEHRISFKQVKNEDLTWLWKDQLLLENVEKKSNVWNEITFDHA
jgi:hypothetical protein